MALNILLNSFKVNNPAVFFEGYYIPVFTIKDCSIAACYGLPAVSQSIADNTGVPYLVDKPSPYQHVSRQLQFDIHMQVLYISF